MFAKFEESNILSEYHNNMEIGHKSDEWSTLPPFVSESETNAFSSGDEFDAETMYTDILEDITDQGQSRPRIIG